MLAAGRVGHSTFSLASSAQQTHQQDQQHEQPQGETAPAAKRDIATLRGSGVEPFVARLQQMEGMLAAMMDAEGLEPRAAASVGGDVSGGREGELSWYFDEAVCEPGELATKAFVVYRFGAHVAGLLASASRRPPVNLLLARTLPAKPSSFPADNAFRNSVHFDSSSRTLFVRQERAGDVGTFTLAIMHAVAHVAARDELNRLGREQSARAAAAGAVAWSDASPMFRRHFLASIRAVCGELFFSRAAASPSVSAPDQRWSELRGVFASAAPASAAEGVAARDDAVALFVSLRSAGSPEDDHFAKDRLLERMQQYKSCAAGGALREHLLALEGEVEAASGARTTAALADSAAALLAEPQAAQENRKCVEAEIERLECHADRAHSDLVQVVENVSYLSARTLELAADPENAEYAASKAALQLQATRKDVMALRIADVERRLMAKRKELVILH